MTRFEFALYTLYLLSKKPLPRSLDFRSDEAKYQDWKLGVTA